MREIRECKYWLESMLGSEVPMFSYPYGYYDESIVDAVRRAGFRGARTMRRFCITKPSNPYEMNITLQACPLSIAQRPPSLSRFCPFINYSLAPRLVGDYLDMRKGLKVSPYYLKDWKILAKWLFELSLRNGGVFHLWGHSWEIDERAMWEDLESILDYISGRRTCSYVTNSEILALTSNKTFT